MVQVIQAVYEKGVLRPKTVLADLKEGQEVVVTVQSLAGEQGEEDRRYAELLRRMEAAGMVEHLSPPTEPPPAGWQPVVLEGEPLSETVIKMRREE
jgi:predicted DNA-binding antitoxin AbrB/MazE fold protein